jgi:hypothetical protein
MRQLEPSDEPAFVALLKAVYGESYSYRELYRPGGVAALIRSGRATLWGDFNEAGELLSHTAFLWKDPRYDYAESGISLRGSRAREGTSDAIVWQRLFGWLSDRCALVHQNTSTWHPLAQRYADRYMRAVPSGIIVDYTVGERLIGIPHPQTPMQALTMTTVVRPDRLPPPDRPRAVPPGPWGAWASDTLRTLGITGIEVLKPSATAPLYVDEIEQNEALSLRRRAIARSEGPPLTPDEGVRTDLVHLAFDARMAAFPALERDGYVPVGARIHASRPDELVLQRLPGERRADAMAALSRAHFAAPGRAFVERWLHACAQTL